MNKTLKEQRYTVVIMVLLLCNGGLLAQNANLRGQISQLELEERPRAAEVGDQLRPFVAPGLEGTVNVAYESTEQLVLLFFTPTCVWCAQQMPHWRHVIETIDPHRFRVVGLVPDTVPRADVERYLASWGISIPVALLSSDLTSDYGVTATPMTLLVDRRGLVQRVWVGAWRDEMISSIVVEFGIAPTPGS